MSDPNPKAISFQTFSKDLLSDPQSKPSPEEELLKIKHEFKIKENNYKKDAALNEQKIELLDIQIKEAKIREENLRKMNDNLTSALSELSQDPRKFQNAGLKEIQLTLEKNSKDFIENKLKNNELIKVLEAELKKMQDAQLQEQLKRKDQDLEKEKEKVNLETKIHELESEKNRLETIIKQIQLDQRKSFDNFTQDNQIKLNKHNEIVEKLKETHEKEIAEIQLKRQQHFNEMKIIYEQEKSSLETRLDKITCQLKQYMDFSTQSFESEKFESLQKEKEKLSQTISEINRNYSDEVKSFRKNKEDLILRIRELEKEVSRLKEENYNYQKLREEKKRMEQEYEKSKETIRNLEKSEKSLKTLLNEYQHNFIIQGNNTETQGSTNHTPQLNCEEEDNDESPPEDESVCENDNSKVLQENLITANRSLRKSKKSGSLASEDFEKFIFRQNEVEINRKSFLNEPENFNRKSFTNTTNLDKSHKKSQRISEDLRKTPITNKTASKLQKTNEKSERPKSTHPPKSSRNNENMPIPISELGLKSDRMAQILENTSYKKKKPQGGFMEKKRLSSNSPFTAMVNLTPNCYQTPVYAEANNNVATALLCEICKNSYPPLEFLEHLEQCKSRYENLGGCGFVNREHDNLGGCGFVNREHDNGGCGFVNREHDNGGYGFVNREHDNGGYGFVNRELYPGSIKMHHHNSHQNLPVYPQPQPGFNSVSEQKRTKSFHYQSAQQLHQCNSMNSTTQGGQVSVLNDHKIVNVLENLTYEKQLIFDKLREVESRLKDTEDKNCMLHEEKVGLQMHFENIVSQLKRAQMQLAMNEEEKSENEINLKKEIKFLIGKLLKAKNKLSEEKSSIGNYQNNNNNSSVNMSGFLNFYQQNKDDSTFGEKAINHDSETSILNQSIQHIISSSALTVNNNKNKPPMMQNPGKGQIVSNKTGSFGRNAANSNRSKTPLMMKFGENMAYNKKNSQSNNLHFNGMNDLVEALEMNNKFKKKK